MSVCCKPGRIRRSPLPILLCYFKRCCFNHTFDKLEGYSKIILLVDFKSRLRRCFVWRCVVDDINRCKCRCVVHPVGSEDPPYRHFELLIALIKLQRIKVSSLQTESPIFLHVFFSLGMVYDQPTAFSVLYVYRQLRQRCNYVIGQCQSKTFLSASVGFIRSSLTNN